MNIKNKKFFYSIVLLSIVFALTAFSLGVGQKHIERYSILLDYDTVHADATISDFAAGGGESGGFDSGTGDGSGTGSGGAGDGGGGGGDGGGGDGGGCG